MSDRIGFIGLGIMGAPMVRNLLRAGHELVGWSRSPARLDAAVADGAERGESPADVAARSDVTIAAMTEGAAACGMARTSVLRRLCGRSRR